MAPRNFNYTLFDLNKCTVQQISEDIVYVYYKDNSVLEIEDLDETLAVFNSIIEANDKNFYIISEFGKYVTASASARKYAETIPVNALAEAMVFSGLAQVLLLRFLQTFRTQQHPMKFFRSKKTAMNWIETLKK